MLGETEKWLLMIAPKDFRFKKVLLLSPSYPNSLERGTLMAGLGYVAEALQQAGIEYDVVNMDVDGDISFLKRRIEAFKPDLIAASMMTYGYRNSYRLLEEVKKIRDVPIAVGGAHASSLEHQIFQECPIIDYCVTGEGEETIVELCKGVDQDQVYGLGYKKDGKIILTPKRDLISQLDELSFPRYLKFDLSKYSSRTIPIVSSRGCPHSCIFCSIGLTMGKKVRMRSPRNVVDELAYWYERGQRRFGIADDNFTFDEQRVFEICDEIKNRKLKGLKLLCNNGVRADKISEELLKRMKEAGFFSLGIGVEGGNDKVLKNIRKGETIATIEKAIKTACSLGYEVSLHFVIGSPGENREDISDTFILAQRYIVQNANFNNLIPYPRTELFDLVKKNKWFVVDPSEYLNSFSTLTNSPVFETPELSKEERVEVLAEAKKVARYVKSKYYTNKFREFGIGASLIGLIIFVLDDMRRFLRNRAFGREIIKILKPFIQ